MTRIGLRDPASLASYRPFHPAFPIQQHVCILCSYAYAQYVCTPRTCLYCTTRTRHVYELEVCILLLWILYTVCIICIACTSVCHIRSYNNIILRARILYNIILATTRSMHTSQEYYPCTTRVQLYAYSTSVLCILTQYPYYAYSSSSMYTTKRRISQLRARRCFGVLRGHISHLSAVPFFLKSQNQKRA